MSFQCNTPLDPTFDHDIRDLHLIYDYDAVNPDGTPTKWRPASSNASAPASNWLEETGTIVSLVYDIKLRQITTLLGFSKGYWENPEMAHGDKRDEEDFERWRRLAKIGTQAERFMLAERATVLEVFRGKEDLEPIEPDAVTL